MVERIIKKCYRKGKTLCGASKFLSGIVSIWNNFLSKSWFYFQVLMQTGKRLHCKQSNLFDSFRRQQQIVLKTLSCMYRN